jgi:outer membrane biosynthesis protein TonB
MNGRFSPPNPIESTRWNASSERLPRALAASLVIHAALVFLPYLGRHDVAGLGVSAPPNQMSSRALSATLINAGNATARVLPPTATDAEHPSANAADPEAERTKEASTSGMDVLPLPGLAFYTTDQVTRKPQPLVLAELDTAETQLIAASGKLVLKLWIDDQGRVVDVLIESSDLPEVFSRIAIAAFKNSRFAPGERNGLRVGTIMRIEISYDDNREP